MPYIILKRSDIPAGALQALDLKPNVSQRNQIYETPGQSKYVDPPQNDALTLVGAGPINVQGDTRGLAAWFVTNVNDGTGAAATGVLTPALTPLTAPGVPYFSVGGVAFVATPGPIPPGIPGVFDSTLPLGPGPGTMSDDIANRINDPVNGLNALVIAAADIPAPGDVLVQALAVGTAGNTIDFTDFSAVGPPPPPGEIVMVPPTPPGTLAGGADADSLTAAEAMQDATDVLTLLRYGDLANPAGALDLASINGALTTGQITAGQLPDVLDILAGREFFVPNGVQVDLDGTTFQVLPPVGSANGPRFITGTLRDIYDTSSLTLSVNNGKLAGFLRNDFEYLGAGGTNGEAIAVYNDDGTLY